MSTPTVPDRSVSGHGQHQHPAAPLPRQTRNGGGRPRRGPANVILVGLSGSGKSTVARLLARRLGWRCVDTDQAIQRQAGITVQQIFETQGEPAFRALETEAIMEACRRSRQVIATGGGAVVADANRAHMLDGNLVVYLESSPEILASRLSRNIGREPRPLLGNSDLIDRLAELRRQREHHYQCAHHIVQTDQRTPREVVDVIAELVRAGS
ncbi:MAG: shikimate kinase [Chloroflexota bacterium]